MPERAEIEQGTLENRAARRAPHPAPRRLAIAIPALAVTALLATGCTADSWPQFSAGTPTPTPTPTVVKPDNQKAPVITQKQGQRIVGDIAKTLAKSDTDLDAALAETRLTGAALAGRQTEYELRSKIEDRKATGLLSPEGKVKILLPEATDSWPRTVLALTVADHDAKKPPVLLTLTQADPWANYRVTAMADMPASSAFPVVAAAWLGTTRVPAESAFLSIPPSELAGAFSNFVDAGDKSEFVGGFDELATKAADSVRASRDAIVKGLKDAGADTTSQATFAMAPSEYEPLSLATLNSGAVVSVSVIDTQQVTPTSPDAVIKYDGNAEAKALTGASEAAKGVETTYGIQLFFAVPAQGSNEQIRLLAYHQDLLSVKVIKCPRSLPPRFAAPSTCHPCGDVPRSPPRRRARRPSRPPASSSTSPTRASLRSSSCHAPCRWSWTCGPSGADRASSSAPSSRR
jgi:hypothetical protein